MLGRYERMGPACSPDALLPSTWHRCVLSQPHLPKLQIGMVSLPRSAAVRIVHTESLEDCMETLYVQRVNNNWI